MKDFAKNLCPRVWSSFDQPLNVARVSPDCGFFLPDF
jgi:hypothetical protein